MPIIKSAKKRVKQAEVRYARNLATKRAIRVETKTLEAAIAAKDAKKATTQLSKVQSALDTAVKKNVIHKNKAARSKASLHAKVKALGGAKPTATKKAVAKKPAAKSTAKKTTAKKAVAKKPAAKKATAKKPAAKSTAKKTIAKK